MLVVLNLVGLTTRQLAHCPRLAELARQGWSRPMEEVLPAVTCSTQASMLTGKLPQEHGIVGNGWFVRESGEVRFWQQSNRLIQAEPVYVTAKRRANARRQPVAHDDEFVGQIAWKRSEDFICKKLFWWFNQGAEVDLAVTPKPHYGADGNKAFDISSYPECVADSLKRQLGPFPFQSFWGPMAGFAASNWIGQCAAVEMETQPHLMLVYLPHLDYETQRLGPSGCDWPRLGREIDDACAPILEAAKRLGADVWVVNECTHVDVRRPVYVNRHLAGAGPYSSSPESSLLVSRMGPFGRQLEVFSSRAFAVCDHQIAHVYVNDPIWIDGVKAKLEQLPGIASMHVGEERAALGLDHPRAGDIVLLSEPDAWFAYPFWLDDREAPDYARTVDIHRKPGYDPCELFFDPKLRNAKFRAMRRLVQKKLGFRTLFDVIPLDASLVRGSHGLRVSDPLDKPVMIGTGPAPSEAIVKQTSVRDRILAKLGLES
jgi:Type I phosphodiesterase / nucleotide pyrophosphatase